MFVYQHTEINDVYYRLVSDVLHWGRREVQHNHTTDQELVTRELHPAIIELQNPRRRLVTAAGRFINVPFALAEVLWILGGRHDVEMLAHYNSRIANYSDDGVAFNAAYGERIRSAFGHDQLLDAATTLRRDRGSRQAVMSIWSPLHDRGWNPDGTPHVTKDRACNVLSHFMIRNGKLDLLQVVRSNDLIWGTPYNLMQWTHVQEYLAWMVGAPAGKYVHVANSLHIYDWHWEEAQRVANAPRFNLYDELEWEHAPLLWGGEDEPHLHRALVLEKESRRRGYMDSFECSELPLAWQRIVLLLRAHDFFKRNQDKYAFDQLTMGDPDRVYMAATLRFWWGVRWYKPEHHERMSKMITAIGLGEGVEGWIMDHGGATSGG